VNVHEHLRALLQTRQDIFLNSRHFYVRSQLLDLLELSIGLCP
jgi:hypothetical protein